MFHTSKHICRSSSMGTIAALAWYVYGHLKCIRCSSFSLYDGVKGLYSAYQHRVDVDNHRPFIFLMEMTVIEQPEDVLVRCHGPVSLTGKVYRRSVETLLSYTTNNTTNNSSIHKLYCLICTMNLFKLRRLQDNSYTQNLPPAFHNDFTRDTVGFSLHQSLYRLSD